MKAEIGVMLPQAKECQGLPEARGVAGNRFSLITHRRTQPWWYLDLGLLPPELWDNKFMLVKLVYGTLLQQPQQTNIAGYTLLLAAHTASRERPPWIKFKLNSGSPPLPPLTKPWMAYRSTEVCILSALKVSGRHLGCWSLQPPIFTENDKTMINFYVKHDGKIMEENKSKQPKIKRKIKYDWGQFWFPRIQNEDQGISLLCCGDFWTCNCYRKLNWGKGGFGWVEERYCQ